MTSSYFIFTLSIGLISSFIIIFSLYLQEIHRTRNTAFIFLLFFTTVYILLFYLLFNQFLLHQSLLCQILLSEWTDSNIYTFLFMLVELSIIEYFIIIKQNLMLFFNQDNFFNYDKLFTLTTTNTFLISSLSKNSIINPWFITGISDGDGSFTFSIIKKAKAKNKDLSALTANDFQFNLSFEISSGNNPANVAMMEQIRDYFGGIGYIHYNSSDNTANYRVYSIADCLTIRNHFVNYPLLTYKLVYFQVWCQALDIIASGAHKTMIGIEQLVELKHHTPKGVNPGLKLTFPNILPLQTFNYLPDLSLINVHWICGFMTADGSFNISVVKSTQLLVGFVCNIRIQITQHNNSLIVLHKIIEFLQTGYLYDYKTRNASEVRITSLEGANVLINLFKDANFLGAKALDYADFCKCIALINNAEHKTKRGINKIKKIVEGMNSKRTNFNQ